MSRAIELQRGGRLAEAARCYRRVLKLRPGDPLGHGNLGMLLQRMGRPEEALEHLAGAYLGAPQELDSRARLVEAVARTPEPRVGPRLRRALATLAEDPLVRHQRLVAPVAGLLKRQPAVGKALRRLEERGGLVRRDLGPELYRSLSDPLVLRLLSDCVFCDAEIEALLTALRCVWLEAVVADAAMAWPGHELLAAIALQAQTTEWIYAETPEERSQLARLEARLAEGEARVAEGMPSRALLLYALYRPLDRYAEDPALLSTAADDEAGPSELMRRHLVEPARERSLRANLPRLTPIEDEVSVRVRAQYEERPYPSWRTLPRRAPRPLGEVLAATLADPELVRSVSTPAPRILVAGCGTGRHAIATATRFTGAEVLAIDLSLTSIGFAARRAERLGIGNIAFAQADILGLEALTDRFDVIECSGVLHHMSDPEAGWRVLRGLLKPRGLMRIALYSERGRSAIDEARALIAEHGLGATVDGIRATRAAIRALPDGAPARRIAASPDFYAVSGCRDLFFHAHEDRFRLPRIASALERLELEFLGFELPDTRVRRIYRERFPRDPAARDLANWDRLEAEIPSLFAAMYAFWCRAKD
jgi:SAM-dependent methyltransferase